MALGTAILFLWLSFLACCAAAGLLVAYTRFGVFLLTRETAAEIAILVAGLGAILYGLPLAAVAYGGIQ